MTNKEKSIELLENQKNIIDTTKLYIENRQSVDVVLEELEGILVIQEQVVTLLSEKKERKMDNSFKLTLLLSCLRITCRYFNGDEEECGVFLNYFPEETEEFESHIACNCDGDINQCDLPDKFQKCL